MMALEDCGFPNAPLFTPGHPEGHTTKPGVEQSASPQPQQIGNLCNAEYHQVAYTLCVQFILQGSLSSAP
jgi:hypothetical protein